MACLMGSVHILWWTLQQTMCIVRHTSWNVGAPLIQGPRDLLHLHSYKDQKI